MIEPDEMLKRLKNLKDKAPEVYRHLIGLINSLLGLAKDL